MPLPENWYVLDGTIADISETNSTHFLVPTAGILRRVETSISAAITVADAVLTVAKNGVALTPTITIATSGSAVGTVDFADFYTQVAKGDSITVTSDGGSTTASRAAVNCILSG
jgi:hypothetical protein